MGSSQGIPAAPLTLKQWNDMFDEKFAEEVAKGNIILPSGSFDSSADEVITGNWDFDEPVDHTGTTYDVKIGEVGLDTGTIRQLQNWGIGGTARMTKGTAAFGPGVIFGADAVFVSAAELDVVQVLKGIGYEPAGGLPPIFPMSEGWLFDPVTGNTTWDIGSLFSIDLNAATGVGTVDLVTDPSVVVKATNMDGPYVDDTAAGVAGVLAGEFYKRSDGVIAFKL